MINKITNKEIKLLIKEAEFASRKAKPKLSKFKVGAVILDVSGKSYSGSNIEFDNYSNTIHAEESAISAYVNGGGKKAIAIAVFTIDKKLWFPCGMCRQSLFEMFGLDVDVIACNKNSFEVKKIGELFPNAFELKKK